MKKELRCSNCEAIYDVDFVCDVCGTIIEDYPSFWLVNNDTDYHFCSHKCLKDFANSEYNKLMPKF